jgi:hypothetical protein
MTVVLVEVPASESGQGTSVLVHELAVSSNVGHLVFKGEGEISNDVRVSVEIRNGLVGKTHGVATTVALKGLGGNVGMSILNEQWAEIENSRCNRIR